MQDKFGKEKISSLANVRWYSLSWRTRSDYVNLIHRSEFHLNDSPFNFGDITQENTDGFVIERAANRELPYRNSWWNTVTFEMSLSRKVYYRVVYSFLDFLADVGGFSGSIGIIFSLIVLVFQYRGPYHLLQT